MLGVEGGFAKAQPTWPIDVIFEDFIGEREARLRVGRTRQQKGGGQEQRETEMGPRQG